ncbi:MAG: FAD binding domain-containing protein, partial [Dehalococcoidia bacterium]
MHLFDYVAPQSLEEAVRLLEQAEGQAMPIAGGTDLIPQIKKGTKQPSLVVDIKRIPEVHRLEFAPEEGLHLGAAVPCAAIVRHPQVLALYPSLHKACSQIGSRQIRSRASVGGNICNAAPSADSIPPLLVHEATVQVLGAGGTRQIPLEELFLGPGQTSLGPSELLAEIGVPVPPAHSSSQYIRFSLREEMDIALVGVAALLALEPGTGRCLEARIALGAVAPTPIRARQAETLLQGQKLVDGLLDRAAELAAQASSPITDIRASAEYRREL